MAKKKATVDRYGFEPGQKAFVDGLVKYLVVACPKVSREFAAATFMDLAAKMVADAGISPALATITFGSWVAGFAKSKAPRKSAAKKKGARK